MHKFYIVFALLFTYSERPSAHKIPSILRTLCASLLLSINMGHKYVQKYVILTNFQYKHSTYVTPVILETNGEIGKKRYIYDEK